MPVKRAREGGNGSPAEGQGLTEAFQPTQEEQGIRLSRGFKVFVIVPGLRIGTREDKFRTPAAVPEVMAIPNPYLMGSTDAFQPFFQKTRQGNMIVASRKPVHFGIADKEHNPLEPFGHAVIVTETVEYKVLFSQTQVISQKPQVPPELDELRPDIAKFIGIAFGLLQPGPEAAQLVFILGKVPGAAEEKGGFRKEFPQI
jgi:hypothetical protein